MILAFIRQSLLNVGFLGSILLDLGLLEQLHRHLCDHSTSGSRTFIEYVSRVKMRGQQIDLLRDKWTALSGPLSNDEDEQVSKERPP